MNSLKLDLKICEGCGALWLRTTPGRVYCCRCTPLLADFPVALGLRRKPYAHALRRRPQAAATGSVLLPRTTLAGSAALQGGAR